MAVLVLCSATGAPGVTVTALGLALTWPRDVLLVDADRTPSQALVAGYLQAKPVQGLGLPGLLQVHRERGSIRDALLPQSLALPEPPVRRPDSPSATIDRRFVPGFVHPGMVDVFGGAWRDLAPALASVPFDVLVDAGRIGTRGLPADLVDAGAQIALLCRTSLVSLAELRLHLPALLDQAAPHRVGLVLVGSGRPYRAPEISSQFGIEVLAQIAWDPAGAADLHEGQPLSPRWRRERLARSYASAADSLAARLEADRLSIGAGA